MYHVIDDNDDNDNDSDNDNDNVDDDDNDNDNDDGWILYYYIIPLPNWVCFLFIRDNGIY